MFLRRQQITAKVPGGNYVFSHMHRDAFLRHYASLPIPVRKEIILDLGDKGPITWDVAFREIRGETPLGSEILKKLVEFKFIPLE